MTSYGDSSTICGLVVSYFPKPGFAENLAALAPQVGKIVVVDNGSIGPSFDLMDRSAATVGAQVVRLGKNLGIASALNAGIEFARDNDTFGWPRSIRIARPRRT